MKSFGQKSWMLPQPVLIIGTYNGDGTANAMNAAWGGQWDAKEIMISMGKHATTENLARCNEFTVAFATKGTMAASDFVGIVSAKNDPENYTSDYTLTIIAVDGSNMVNQDSKRLDIDFNADDIAELKDTNIAEQEGFKISYRSAKDLKAVEYKRTEGIFTINEITKDNITFVFNRLKLEGKSNNILLPDTENPTLTVQGEVKCSL